MDSFVGISHPVDRNVNAVAAETDKKQTVNIFFENA